MEPVPSSFPKTVPETAAALGVSIHTIRAWIAQHRLGYLKLGRAVRIPQSEIERVLRDAAVPAMPSVKARNGQPGSMAE